MKESLFSVLAIAVIVLVFLFALGAIRGKQCNIQSVSFSDHSYTIIGGCMVEHEGKWLPLENIRGFD